MIRSSAPWTPSSLTAEWPASGAADAVDRGALPRLTEFEASMYARQISLPGLGEVGQRRLKGASVLVSRAGGLGGTVALQLAKAGIGRLILAHDGIVEAENLNRMLLAMRADLGRTRVEAFKETLAMVNPSVEVIIEADNANRSNASELAAGADVIVDAAPLFEERYALNEAAVTLRTPLVTAAMFGLEGYVTTIDVPATPCLACIYPAAPPEWDLRCFPVVLPSSALLGTVAAMEVIKVLTGCGTPLHNTLLYCDLMECSFRRLSIAPRADCEVCGRNG
jgi:molybdopterin/thiamine biosynthesis adenylyltransferase